MDILKQLGIIQLSLIFVYNILIAGLYEPKAGVDGSNAIISSDSKIVSWATNIEQVNYGDNVVSIFRTPEKALGQAELPGGDTGSIVSLGSGGSIVLTFNDGIGNEPGPDFAVFENGFSDFFIELAFVEVSSDGINFFRFPNDSLTERSVGPFGLIEPSNLNGLAGKYRIGYGTPFDLDDLADNVNLNKHNIRFVRIIDIIGDGLTSDSQGDPIYDPYPTAASAGFDLDAVGVINIGENENNLQLINFERIDNNIYVSWKSNSWKKYDLLASENLNNWNPLFQITGKRDVTDKLVPINQSEKLFIVIREVN